MKSDITKLQINTIIALALMRYLYRKREISEKVYRKILQKYGKVLIAKESKFPSLTVLKYKIPFKPRVLAALEGIYISF